MSAELELAEAAAYASLTETAGLPELVAERVLERRVAERETRGLEPRRLDARARQQELVRHLTEQESRGEGGQGEERRAPQDAPERARELAVLHGLGRHRVHRAREGRRVERVEDGRDFGPIIAAAYGMPAEAATTFDALPRTDGWHCFVAYDGDDAAGAAALYVHGTTAWLGVAGTAPEHRRKGAQTALLAARIAAGRAEGVHRFTTETGERIPDRPSNSYRNILRAGFEERYVRPNAVAP